MSGRGITNILLAVIAGVLLFGREAIASGLQGAALFAFIVLVLWLGLVAVAAILRWIASEWSAANNIEEKFSVAFSTMAGCILTPLVAYALWLWMSGVEKLLAAVVFSPLGYAWIGLVILLFAVYGVIGARYGTQWLLANRGDVPGFIGHRLWVLLQGYLEFLGGPITFPIREWRIRSKRGWGTAAKIVSATFMMVIGIVVSLMTGLFTAIGVLGLLSTLGVIDY